MDAYGTGLSSKPTDTNPYHYRFQRVYFDAWKKGRNDQSDKGTANA